MFETDFAHNLPRINATICRPGSGALVVSLAFPKFQNLLDSSPAQETRRAENKAPDNYLVLVAVSLEAHGLNVLVRRILADVDTEVADTERLCALRTRRGRRPLVEDGLRGCGIS
jgi:hypothetical protein